MNFFGKIDNVILVGDFNAKSTLWDLEGNSDREGILIEDALVDSNIICFNKNRPTHFYQRNDIYSYNVLDLSFASSNIRPLLGWKTLEFDFDSDHFPIVVDLKNCFSQFLTHRPKLILQNVSCKDFESKCNIDFDNISTDYDTSTLINEFNNLVTNSLIDSGAKLQSESHRKKDSFCWWWDENYAKLINEKIEAYKLWKINPSLSNLIIYENISKKIKKILKNLEKFKFKSFNSSLNRNSNLSQVRKVINNMVKTKNSAANSSQGNLPDHQIIMNKFSKMANMNKSNPSQDISDKKKFLLDTTINCSRLYNDILTSDISYDELISALNSFKSDSSPGPDLIGYKVLKALPANSYAFLPMVFNKILSSGNIPDCWRENIVIFIPKPGSHDVRPITLTSNLSKFFERIIYRRLEFWCDKNNIIPAFQFGFQRGKSVLDPINILYTYIEYGFSLGKITGAIFLDLKGAFENVDPFLLCKLLCRLGIFGDIKMWRLLLKFASDKNIYI